MEKEKKKYPIGADYYTLYEEVGTGGSATVYRALCIPLNEIVAIKILDFERSNCNLNNVSQESQTMVLVDHPNVLKSHCSFVNDHTLWFVMPYLSGGSCLHILKAAHPNGFEEVVIATILREVLKGLDYLHQHGHIHRDVKAGNVLIDSRSGIKLADFGVSAYMFNAGDRQRRNTFVGTPCWMAPEVMEQLHGYDCKADIWSFGITALELARGHAPFSKYPPMKVLLLTLQNAPPGLDHERDKKFSRSFRHMIGSCLVKDPIKRPSAKELLKYSFFKQARSNDYIARTLLAGLPALGDRLQALKKQDEDMLAQKKMPDGEKEERSQNEYKRGISGWNFDLEDLKAQASLIPDDDAIAEKDKDMQSKQLQHQSSLSRNFSSLQHQLSFSSQRSDANDSDDNVHTSLSSPASTINIEKGQKSNYDVNVSGSTIKQSTSNTALGSENLEDKPVSDMNKGAHASSNQSPMDKAQNHSQNLPNNGTMNLQISDDAHLEAISKVNGDEVDEKAKAPVVKQKGRFKVTSENVEIEKVVPTPVLLKSHSMQVIPQHPAVSSLLPYNFTPSSPLARTLACLQSVLQINIQERDYILGIVKQVAAGDSTDIGYTSMNGAVTETSLGIAEHPAISSSLPHDASSSNPHARALASLQVSLQANIQERDYILGQIKQVTAEDSTGCTVMNAPVTQKSLLESAHDREKNLLTEIIDLHWRLLNVQEELKKYKTQMKS